MDRNMVWRAFFLSSSSPCHRHDDACLLVRVTARDPSPEYSGFSGLWEALMRWGQVGCGGLAVPT